MPLLERAITLGEIALALAILTGLLVRGHVAVCVSFALYLVAFIGSESLILGWPDRFWTLAFWVVKEAIQALLKFALLLELIARLFRNLPGARQTSAWLMFLLVLFMGAGVRLTWDGADLASAAVPPLLYATAAGFTILLLTVAWYHVPLHQLHKAILLGLAPYLFVFTVIVQSLATYGWFSSSVRGYATAANTAAYVAILLYWVREAWRRYAAPSGISRTVSAYLQPWAPQR